MMLVQTALSAAATSKPFEEEKSTLALTVYLFAL